MRARGGNGLLLTEEEGLVLCLPLSPELLTMGGRRVLWQYATGSVQHRRDTHNEKKILIVFLIYNTYSV